MYYEMRSSPTAKRYNKFSKINKKQKIYQKRFFSFCIFMISMLVGSLHVIQAGLNVQCSLWLKNPIRSAFLSFFIGTLFLIPFFIYSNEPNITFNHLRKHTMGNIFLYSPKHKTTPMIACQNLLQNIKRNKINAWVLLNGTLGGYYVCCTIFITPMIGFSLYFICIVIGQICTSIIIDKYGLVWTEKRYLSLINISGAMVTFIGVVVFQISSSSRKYNYSTIAYILLAITAGILVTFQASLNQRLQYIINGSPSQAAFLSFANSSIVLLFAALLTYILHNDWFLVNSEEFYWYNFFGAICGVFAVILIIICLIYIGFRSTFVGVIFGNLLTSLVFDFVGAFNLKGEKYEFAIFEVIGVCIVLIGGIFAKKNSVRLGKISDSYGKKSIGCDSSGSDTGNYGYYSSFTVFRETVSDTEDIKQMYSKSSVDLDVVSDGVEVDVQYSDIFGGSGGKLSAETQIF